MTKCVLIGNRDNFYISETLGKFNTGLLKNNICPGEMMEAHLAVNFIAVHVFSALQEY